MTAAPAQEASTSDESSQAPDAEATPTPGLSQALLTQEAIGEALRIAALHGLTEDDLRGEYALFSEFTAAVEANEKMGPYKEFMYRIFPVIADNVQYMDTEYLMSRVRSLSYIETEILVEHLGEYDGGLNKVMLNTIREPGYEQHIPGTVFHELMHFLDHSAGSDSYSLYYFFEGKTLSLNEFLALSYEDECRARACCVPDYLFEGGAELFTAKYFAGAVESYMELCRFLSGIEYIYGTERLKELFFSADSDVLIAELFFDAGYSYDRYADATASLNALTYPDDCAIPENYITPEEILIDLYKAQIGDGWETDRAFGYIIDGFDAEWDYCEVLNAKIYADLPFTPTLFQSPPMPIICDGKMTFGAYATWTDPDTGRTVRGTISADYDFDNDQPLGYQLIDLDNLE